MKSGGHRARFDVTMPTNTAILDPLTKTARSPKLDKKETFFQWCMWYRTEFDFNVLFIHWSTRKMRFNALVFTLRSVIAQSVQLSKIAKKLNIDLCQFFSHRKEALSLLKSWNKKMGVTVLVFAVELQKVRTKCIFLDFWDWTGASFKIECLRKWEESIKKSVFTEFASRYHI